MLTPFKVMRRALLVGAGVTAAAMMAGTTPATAESVETIFPTPPTTFAIPHYIAIDKGYYSAQGLDVKDTHLLGDANAFRTLVSGAGDVVLVGPSTTMLGSPANAHPQSANSQPALFRAQISTAALAVSPSSVALARCSLCATIAAATPHCA